VASGFPWVIISSAMILRLAQADLSLSAIGVFGSVTGAYAINFLWAPFVDRLQIPDLGKLLGQRRSWIMVMQVLIAGATLALAFTDPLNSLTALSLAALVAAVASATQDVAIDAYRIEVIPREKTEMVSQAASAQVAGWWTGFGLLGSLPFFLIDLDGWDWTQVYLVLAAVWIPLLAAVLLAPRSVQRRDKFAEAEAKYQKALGAKDNPNALQRFTAWMGVTLVEPLREFLVRVGPKLAWSVIVFIFIFKIGEAFLGRMSIAFYEDIGFTASQIGLYSKVIGAVSTIVFTAIGGFLNARLGLIRGLVIGGIVMAATNLFYTWMALSGPVVWIYLTTVLVDGFTQAFSIVAFVAFISYLTSHTFTATQYALLASIGNFGRTTMSAASGFMVEALQTWELTLGPFVFQNGQVRVGSLVSEHGDWALFFIITALMVIPSLLLLIYVRKRLYIKQKEWAENPPEGEVDSKEPDTPGLG